MPFTMLGIEFMSLTVTGDVVTVADSQISCTDTPSETPDDFVQMVVAPKVIQTPIFSSETNVSSNRHGEAHVVVARSSL